MALSCQRCGGDATYSNVSLSIDSGSRPGLHLKVVCGKCVNEVLDFAKPKQADSPTKRSEPALPEPKDEVPTKKEKKEKKEK